MQEETARPAVALHSDLERNAIGALGATMQAITHISPAIAAFFYTQFVVSLAGITAPIAYLIGFVLVLMLGNSLVQLSKHMPSAGGYYTYVSRAIHPRIGFLTSWMYVLYSPLCGGPIYGFFGFIAAGALKSYYNIDVPWLWWVCIAVGAPLVAYLQHEGIKISTKAMLVLGAFEIGIVFLLALSGFLHPGPGGISLAVFNPGNMLKDSGGALAISGFTLAIVFSVQGLTGWEAAAPLAEETKDPRRNVPISVIASIVLLGAFLVFVFWGIITYFGVDSIDTLIGSKELPALAMAQDLWGGFWLLLLFAFLNSVIAVCLATANVGTRMWYAMARSGSFPKVLAKVEPKRKTPTNAILLQMALSLVAGLGTGFVFGADVSFFLIDGLILVIGVTVVYLFANLAVFMYYRGEKKAEFNVLLHVVFPLLSSLVLIYAVIQSFNPAPAAPYSYAPFIDGAWFLLGVIILVVLRSRGREDWLLNAGEAIADA
ncbi:MAG: APC family permease [Chloroflexota bacterium]